MAFSGQSLVDGTIPLTRGAIYTASAGFEVIVRSFDIGNPTGYPVKVKLYITRLGSSARFVGGATIEAEGSLEVLSHGKVWVLSGQDAIEAEADADGVLEFVMTGARQS